MLMLHALAQPYKTRRHNVIDILIFSNLLFINAFSIFIYIKSSEKIYRDIIAAVIHIQTFLMSLLLVVLSLFLMFLMAMKLKQSVIFKRLSKSKCKSVDSYMLSNEFPPRMFDSDDGDESAEYRLAE